MKNLILFFNLCSSVLIGQMIEATNHQIPFQNEAHINQANTVFQYFLHEVEIDDQLSHEEQHNKIQEFVEIADNLTAETALHLTHLLIDETRVRILDMLQKAGLEKTEIDGFLADYEEAISKVHNMNVEIAREMLFFVAELKLHRQFVYDFGVMLGVPEEQLLRHDLCKLEVEQFEGYARYFRGGKQDQDKAAYLDAWGHHQYEEHHHQSYSKENFSFDNFSEERIQNNMLETVADLLAANKQRGGGTLLEYLLDIFPKQNPHPRLLPYLEDGLKKAHAFYLESDNSEDPMIKMFQGLPCWNSDVEQVFCKLKASSS